MRELLHPDAIIDGFRVGECIHQGGTGAIYRATAATGADSGFPMILKAPYLGRGESTVGIISLEMEQLVLDRAPRSTLRRSRRYPRSALHRHARYPDLLAEERHFAAGSSAYVSREQLQGNRSDLFALGVLLYELATGKQPFGDPQTYAGMRDRL